MLRWASLGAIAIGLLTAAPVAAQDVTVFGADWCGNCRAMRAPLDREGVAYDWRDTEVPANVRAMKAEGGSGAIPFWIIRGRKGVGFNLPAIERALRGETRAPTPTARPTRKPLRTRAAPRAPTRPPAWWRGRAQALHRDIARLERAVRDNARSAPAGRADRDALLHRQLSKARRDLTALQRAARAAGVPATLLAPPG